MGWTARVDTLQNKVFCSDWCAKEPPVTPMEVRNDQMAVLYASGRSAPWIAKMYGVSHPFVYKVLRGR